MFPQAARTKPGRAFVPMSLEADSSDRGLGTIALKTAQCFRQKPWPKVDRPRRFARKEGSITRVAFGIDRLSPGKWKITETTRPNLLFIHGTNSSTWGSFAEIRDSVLWKHTQDTYSGNIFGLQHER